MTTAARRTTAARWRTVALAITAMTALAACQAASPTAAPPVGTGSPSAAPNESSGAGTSEAPGASGQDIPADMIVGAGDVIVGDQGEALAALGSHRAVLTLTFDGTIDGSARHWTSTTTLVVSTDPAASVLTVEVSGDAGGGEDDVAPPAWQAQERGIAHVLDDSGACSTRALEDGEAPLAEPATSLPAIFGGTAAGSEAVAGTAADVVTFDAAAIGFGPDVQVDGKAWVASGSELLLRLTSTTTGADSVFGEKASGTLTTSYELLDVGTADATIPVGCGAGLVDVPKADDATIVTNAPGVLRYTTAASVRAIAKLYKDAAAGLGWKAGEANIFDKVAFLHFTAPGLAVDIVATSEGGTTTVRVLTSRAL